MCGRIMGVSLAIAAMFVMVVDLHKSLPPNPWQPLSTSEIPLWGWIDGWMPVLTTPTTLAGVLQDLPFVAAAFVVGGGIFLAIGPGKKSGKKPWEK
jgi:hypothetical protein